MSRLLLVCAGGCIGTGARVAMIAAFPVTSGFPGAMLLINLLGAFALGLLLEALLRRERGGAGGVRLRLFLGTGLLGGFTSYSALAEAVVALTASDAVMPALLYGLGTVLLGGLASWAGIAVASLVRKARRADAGEGDRA